MMADLAAADKAGDQELARHIASQIKALQKPAAAAAQKPPDTSSPYSPANLIGAAVEPMMSMGSGMLSGPVSGLAGIAGSLLPGPEGQGARWTEKTGKALTYEPKTAGGKTAMGAISYPFEKLQQGAEWAGGKTTDVTGSPLAGTIVDTLLQAFPQLALAKGAKPGITAAEKTVRPIASSLRDEIIGPPTAKPEPPARQQARGAVQSGFTVPPTQANPSLLNRVVEGFGGKALVQQEADIKNAARVNELAREDLGLPKDQPISVDALDQIRATEGKAYSALKGVPNFRIRLDVGPFVKKMNELAGDYNEAVQRFPGLFKKEGLTQLKEGLLSKDPKTGRRELTTTEALETIKQLRSEAATDLKRWDDNTSRAIGFAKREAATALEQLMDTALKKGGKGDLVDAYRAARQKIAKTYDVEAALNDATGNIDARKLAQISKKRPLSGALADIAEFGGQFPKVAMPPEKFGGHPGINPLDVGLALMEVATTGKPTWLATVLGRPAFAKLATSGPYQRRFVGPRGAPTGPGEGMGAELLRGLPFGPATYARNE